MTPDPGVLGDLARSQPLRGLAPQQTAQQALGLRRHRVRDRELAPLDLAEQGQGLGVMEGVAPHQHGVEHHPEAPDVGGPARVAPPAGAEDLGGDVGGAAVLVGHQVVGLLRQDHRVLKPVQPQLASENTNNNNVNTTLWREN